MAKSNEMFESMDLFALIQDTMLPTAQEEEEKKVKPVESTTTETSNNLAELDGEEEDDSLDLEEDEDSTAEEKKPAVKQKKSAPKTVKLPVRCIGRNFDMEVSGSGTLTYEELLGTLYAQGIKEVAHSDVRPLENKGGVVYFNYPTKGSNEGVQVFPGEHLKALIASGMDQLEVVPELFEGYLQTSPNEISVGHLLEKWTAEWPIWNGEELNYDVLTQVAIPVGGKTLTDSDQLTFPIDVIKSGLKITLSAEDFPMSETITHKEIVDYLWGQVPVKVSLHKLSSGVLVANYAAEKSGAPIQVNRNFAKVNDKSTTTMVTESYALPLNLYFVTLNQRRELNSSMFNGKERVTEIDVLELLKQSYSMLRSKDRRIDSIYVKETHTLSVALVSGTKGSASFALPEPSSTGLFKLIRTREELEEVKKEPFFLGNLFTRTESARVEVNPIGCFLGMLGNGRQCCDVLSVKFESKLPKIPRNILNTIIADFSAHAEQERIVRIYYDSRKETYVLIAPLEKGTVACKASIRYTFERQPDYMHLFMTVHSHNTMPAYFSSTDDKDEAITGIYGVIGTVDKTPSMRFRIGMEGTFTEVNAADLFEEV